MRRDYFICIFLLLVAIALAFVCLLPTYYSYDGVIEREVGLIETLASTFFCLLTLLIFPVFTAIKKKFWAMLGNAAFGLLAFIPGIFLPRMAAKLAAPDVNILTTVKALFFKAIYTMVYAPFAGIGNLAGNKLGLILPKLILPVTLVIYGVVKLFRFYKEAYIAEQLAPVPTNDSPTQRTRKPDILGTVISAPVTPPTTPATPAAPTASTAPVAPVTEKKPADRPSGPAVPPPSEKPAEKLTGNTSEKPKQIASEENGPKKIPSRQRPELTGVRTPNISPDVIPLGAPPKKQDDVILLSGPSDKPIELGPPPEEPKNP